jgi:hypothetical protein
MVKRVANFDRVSNMFVRPGGRAECPRPPDALNMGSSSESRMMELAG